ncbi:MAG: hypothetical protein J1E98_05665 [Lachnospiraceae bacterium]|nr:hypothetical protein [Lachnospiraceae bacterium]
MYDLKKEDMNVEHNNHTRNRDEKRAIQQAKRNRQVRMYKICIAVFVVLFVCAGCGAIIWNLPSLKLSRMLSAGDKYTESGDYVKANDSYEKALKIDSGTVEAYRCLANNDLEQDNSTAAKKILYSGWENTQDESLLHYYCVVVLNEAVAQINEKKCSMETVDKCLQVLNIEKDNEDALHLLDVCYDRLYTGRYEDDAFTVFLEDTAMKEDEAEEVSLSDILIDSISFEDVPNDIMTSSISKNASKYENYENQLRSLLALYEETESDAIEKIIAQYALLDIEYVYFSVNNLTKYYKLLEDVYEAVQDKSIEELMECLSQAIKVQEDFADIFTEFAQGNYESAKDFIVSDTYVNLRDSFINGESGYWEGSAAVPLNQDQMVLHKTDDGFKFFYPDYDDYENTQGVITVWGSRQLDDGVQRTTISYEPVSQNGEYYPHTEYVISYEYSNVLKNGTDIKMNYRLNTTTTTEEGAETEAIGDWGGEHEWKTSY